MTQDTDEKIDGNKVIQNLPKTQKIAVISLATLAVAIVVLSVWQFSYRVNSPFKVEDSKKEATNVFDFNTDTDKDGLKDYDEINVYQTSVYLEDSDSDGISDKDEVDRGTNPNCPEGTDCNNSSSNTNFSGSAVINDDISDYVLPSDLNAASSSEESLRNALSGETSATELRKILIESGADQDLLNQISDEDLLKSYQEVLNNQNIN